MIDCRFRVLQEWPGKATADWQRKASPFKAGWQNTLNLLEKELNYLKAKSINVEGFFRSQDIRNDGWPKSSARPQKPGVIVSFDTKAGRLSMPCDRFLDWEANLRAIALTLEHLRAAERYGVVSDRHEQYTGWLKLGATSESDELPALAQVLISRACLSVSVEKVLADRELFDSVWKEAARRTHPDSSGAASAGPFRDVIRCRDRVRELKGWAQ